MQSDKDSICTICSSQREKCFTEIILGKYNVQYWFCQNCGLLQTEDPYWLEEAYSEAIADADTGLVSRNYNVARKLSIIISLFFDSKGTYVDVAGGYGLLARLMRDMGFEFLWDDIHCANIFARGFEYDGGNAAISGVTAIEVLEHTPDPMLFIEQQLALTKEETLIFTTELYDDQPPEREWWYYAFPTGQHISFFQHRTLKYIAKKLGLNLYSHQNWHILTRKRINTIFFKLAMSRLMKLFSSAVRYPLKTKTLADHKMLLDQVKRSDSNQ